MTTTDQDALEVLLVARSELEAEAIAGGLRGRGVQAQVFGGMLAGFRAEAPADVKVMVRGTDLPRAREALGALRAESGDIDWEGVDVGVEGGAGAEGGEASADGESGRPRRQLLTSALFAAALAVAIVLVADGAAMFLPKPMKILAGVLLLTAVTIWLSLITAGGRGRGKRDRGLGTGPR